MRTVYSFGEFELNAACFELRRNGQRVGVQPKVLKLLIHLVANRQRGVSESELLRDLWPDETVGNGSLRRAVRGARIALGESGDGASSIRTVRSYGYRFIAEVREAAVGALSEPVLEAAPELRAVPVADALLPRAQRFVVRVYPFTSVGRTAVETELGYGVAADLVRRLGRWRLLPVSLESASVCCGAADVVSPRVKARFAVHGSVRVIDARVCVRVRLTDTSAAGADIWAERFVDEIREGDSFGFEDRVAAAISPIVREQLFRVTIRHLLEERPQSDDAWELALRGLFHLSRRGRADNQRAIRYFSQSIERDTDGYLAMYHLGRAAYLNVHHVWTDDAPTDLRLAAWAADRCRAIDASDPHGHMLNGLVRFAEGASDRALCSLRAAVEADPTLYEARSLSSIALSLAGCPDEALRDLDAAGRLGGTHGRPGKLSSALACAYFAAERYEEAAASAERAVTDVPHSLAGNLWLTASLGMLGNRERAARAATRLRNQFPSPNRWDNILRTSFNSSASSVRDRFFGGLSQAGMTGV